MKKKPANTMISTVPIPPHMTREVDFFIERLAELLLKQVEVKNENKNEKRQLSKTV
jgi:hypothetical protein